MAKNVLKAWLVDNTVTADDKTDKIFSLETTRSIDKGIILDRMVAKNPGVAKQNAWDAVINSIYVSSPKAKRCARLLRIHVWTCLLYTSDAADD